VRQLAIKMLNIIDARCNHEGKHFVDCNSPCLVILKFILHELF